MRNIIFCVFFLLLYLYSFAEGIQINYQSARFAAMGHSGVGTAKEASSLYFNPAASAMLYGNEMQFGMSNYKGFTTYRGGSPSVYSTVMSASPQIPLYFYGTFQPKKGGRFTFGIAFNKPFGTGIKWDDDWKGRFIVQQNLLNTICVQPTIAFRLNEHLSLGAGFMYYLGDLQFQKAIPQTQIEGKEGWMRLNGKGVGGGLNMGIHYRLNERFSVGISYRSAVNWQIKNGKAIFEVPISIRLLYPDSHFETAVTLPSQLSLGLSFMPTPNILLLLNVVQNGWTKWDSTSFNFQDTLLKDISYKRGFRNNFQFSGGAEFKVFSKAFFRVGAFYYLSPQTDDFVTPEMPDANSIGLTTGIGYNFNYHFSIDMAAQYDFTGDRTAQFKQLNFAGTYISNGYQIGAGLKYKF